MVRGNREIDEAPPRHAVVIGSSRRFVHLLTDDSQTLKAQSSSKALDITVGDNVLFMQRKADLVVTEILEARNYLTRSYRDETRKIAANLDQLFVVTAAGPLFNTFFVDRIMTVAACQQIPCTLVVNKVDLGIESLRSVIEVYEQIGVPVVYTSAKGEKQIEVLEQALANPELKIVALCGISGVGKSTLLNELIPGTKRKTAEVSERTGQGRQTTTQAYAYVYERESDSRLLVIDLPGMQSFGVTHLAKINIAESFPEFLERAYDCEFGNCSHIAEENCAIKLALEKGEIAPFRYDSYVRMLAEIEEARPY